MIEISHKIKCDDRNCDVSHSQVFTHYMGAPLAQPLLPEGWSGLGDFIFCPKHDVRLISRRRSGKGKRTEFKLT